MKYEKNIIQLFFLEKKLLASSDGTSIQEIYLKFLHKK